MSAEDIVIRLILNLKSARCFRCVGRVNILYLIFDITLIIERKVRRKYLTNDVLDFIFRVFILQLVIFLTRITYNTLICCNRTYIFFRLFIKRLPESHSSTVQISHYYSYFFNTDFQIILPLINSKVLYLFSFRPHFL